MLKSLVTGDKRPRLSSNGGIIGSAGGLIYWIRGGEGVFTKEASITGVRNETDPALSYRIGGRSKGLSRRRGDKKAQF